MLAYCLPCADVLVYQHSGVAHANQQPVVRQELKLSRLDVIRKPVELDTIQIVHVYVFRLSDSVERLVLQESEAA